MIIGKRKLMTSKKNALNLGAIASLSFGADRKFSFKQKVTKETFQ